MFEGGDYTRSQPHLALRNGRVSDRRGVHARVKQLLRKLERFCGIPNMDWNDRRLTRLELKSALLQFTLEKLGVRPQFLHQPLALRRIQQGKRRLASRPRSPWVRSRKQERPRPQIQKLNQVARPANIPAHRSNRLAKRAHLK